MGQLHISTNELLYGSRPSHIDRRTTVGSHVGQELDETELDRRAAEVRRRLEAEDSQRPASEQHEVSLEHDNLGAICDTADWRAVCKCGWKSKWSNGWKWIARRRGRKHLKALAGN